MSDRELWEVAKATAKTVSIVDFENAHGVDFVRFSGREYMHPLYDSLKVNGYLWKRHSGLTGKLGRFTSGTAITYVMEYYGLSFRDAVHELLDFANPELLAQVKGSSGSAVREEAVRQYSSVADILRRAKADRETEEKKKLIKPMPDKDNAELIEYLCKTRGINRDLVDLCIKRGLLYRIKADALKRSGRRTDLSGEGRYSSKAEAGRGSGDTEKSVARYIRLTFLDKRLLDMVDSGRLKFVAGVELSYLDTMSQKLLLDVMEDMKAVPNLAQAKRLKLLCRHGAPEMDEIESVLHKPKKENSIPAVDMKKLLRALPAYVSHGEEEEWILAAICHYAAASDKN